MATQQEWLSQSRVNDYGRCPFRYKLVHVDKLVRRYTPKPLRRGTLIHKGFDAALNVAHRISARERDLDLLLAEGKDAIYKEQATWLSSEQVKPFITPDMRDIGEQLAVDAGQIFARAFKRLGVHEGKWTTVVDKAGTPMIEYKMQSPHPGWAGEQGTADWVAREEGTGHVWLWDWKSRKQMQQAEYDRLQLQHPTYIHLLRETEGLEVVGAVTYQIRAAVPKLPKRLKNGNISIAQCLTDWETYSKAVHAAGLNVDDYLHMKDSGKLSTFFNTAFYHWTPDAVRRVYESAFFDAAERMKKSHEEHVAGSDAAFPRNLNPYNCRGCTHHSLCEADIRGEDVEFLSRTEYMDEGEIQVPELELVSDD